MFINEKTSKLNNLQDTFNHKIYGYSSNYLVYDDQNLIQEIIEVYSSHNQDLMVEKTSINDFKLSNTNMSKLIYIHLQ